MKKLRPPSFKSIFFWPDAQVKKQRIIQVEPEDQKTSGRATRKTQAIGKVSSASTATCKGWVPESPVKASGASDKQKLGRSREIPRENNTRTGGHCIWESPLVTNVAVFLRNQTGSTESNVKHLIRASPFAAFETSTTAPQNQHKSQ